MKARTQKLSKKVDLLVDFTDSDLALYVFTVWEAILPRRGRHEEASRR